MVKFKLNIYRMLCFLCVLMMVFYAYDGSLVVMRNRLISVAVAFVALFFNVDFKKCRFDWLDGIALGLISAGGAYLCCQLFLDLSIIISPIKIVGTMIFYLGVFALIWAVTLKTKAAAIGAVSIAAILSLIETYVYAFRGTSFKLVDIFALRTAMGVADEYRFFVNTPIITGALFYLAIVLLCCFGISVPNRSGWRVKNRAILCVFSCVFVSTACALGTQLERVEYQFRKPASATHGVTMNLICELVNGIEYAMPDGYAEFHIADMENEYLNVEETEKKPHIIVVMNETYTDFRVFNDRLSTERAVTPFADELEENTVKGFALASILGGGTVNSEYEFLTGNTMAFMPSGIAPFQHYVKEDTYSIVSYLNSLGYRSVGIHPGEPLNWMREAAWTKMGFEEVMFVDDFPQQQMIKGRVSDMEFVETVLEVFKGDYKNQPMFLFGVTIQNHSPYNDKSFEATNKLVGYTKEYPEAEQFLSLMTLSDAAMGTLVTELSKLDEDVILLVYGDHQPIVEEAFIEELNGSPLDTWEESEKRHTIPFYIWANYDIPEKTVELTSLNYLSNYLLEYANLPLAPYNQYLKDLEMMIPAMNSLGFYSRSSGQFLTYADAAGMEKENLNVYAYLQYHSVFEKENRSQVFFPN